MSNKDPLHFGPVAILKGKHKGFVGFYDDDLGEKTAIVYLGAPFVSPLVHIRHDSLVNVESIEITKFRRANPEFCEKLGV